MKKVLYKWHPTSQIWSVGEVVEEQPARVLIRTSSDTEHWFFKDLIKPICERDE